MYSIKYNMYTVCIFICLHTSILFYGDPTSPPIPNGVQSLHCKMTCWGPYRLDISTLLVQDEARLDTKDLTAWFPTANCCVNFSGNRATHHDVGITESLCSTSRSLGSNVFSCIFPRTEFSSCSLAINLAATCVVNQVYVEGCEICQIVTEISSELVAIKVCHHESHESCSADPF